MRKETVFLVHGLWMNGLELLPLSRSLRRAGYEVHLFRYPTRRSLARSAWRLRSQLDKSGPKTIHLVAHSLGGLLLCLLAGQHGLPENGKILMLGTPLSGCHAAQAFGRWRLGRWMLGEDTLKALLGERPRWPANRPLGVIAGNRGIGLGALMNRGLPAPHDGTVSVAETLTHEVTQHLIVRRSHFGMLWARDVHAQVLHYLATGSFRP